MIEWNIQSRAHACQSCERRFADKESYHTLLTEARSGYERMDVCEACWSAQYGQGAVDRKGFVSHWQGVYHAPPAAPPDAIQKESAETLLRKLVEQGDPKHGPACYILAVMLERKRLLKIKEQFRREGQRVFIYEHPKTGDIFTITDPDLQLNQLDAVQRDVADLLENGLNVPASAAVVAVAAVVVTEGEAPAEITLPDAPTEAPDATVPASEGETVVAEAAPEAPEAPADAPDAPPEEPATTV